MAKITVTADDFINDFPEFTSMNVATINSYITQAQCYISTDDYGILKADARQLAIELMTAHLLTLWKRISEDGQSQATFVASANIGSVNVSLAPPNNHNQYEFWLNLTIYGTRLWALLSSVTPCGFYVAGSPQRVLI